MGRKKNINDEISYTCKWQHHSRCSKFRAAGKSTKELAASKVMYHKYVAFVHKRLSTILFGGQSLALVDMLTMILRDLEDHPSA